MSQETISYSDKVNGWTSFHSFVPDWMAKLNNRFFSIKGGQLWLHNDETNPVRNNFYGEQFDSKIVPVLNDSPSDDKIFKTLVLQSTHSWDAKIKTNYTESTIANTEFNKRESRFFAHTRRSESQDDKHAFTAQGVGVIVSSSGLDIVFGVLPEMINVGDKLYQVNGSANELIGVITNISGTTLTVNAITTAPANGFFCYAEKNARVEGSDMRGYYAEIELTNSYTEAVELFAIESNIVKSYV